MSHEQQARVVLEILGLRRGIDVLVTREDVQEPKPAPEIYLVTAARLGVPPAECFVLEDSDPGVRSAVAAGMVVVAITNELTRDAVHRSGVLPPERIVDDGAKLEEVVMPLLQQAAAARPAGRSTDRA
jgi:beta-phosphoglucomutase-like phosphatase (HAD superfamily)